MIDHTLRRAAGLCAGRSGGVGHKGFLLLLCCWLGAGGLACEGGGERPPGARQDSFAAEVRGAFREALHGDATLRLDSAGRLAGLELDAAADTNRGGFSFEVPPQPSAGTRTYVVSPRGAPARGDTARASHVDAYLRLRGYAFAARAGSLRVTRDGGGRLHGTFDLRLRGTVDAASDEPATVAARGRFAAPLPARHR